MGGIQATVEKFEENEGFLETLPRRFPIRGVCFIELVVQNLAFFGRFRVAQLSQGKDTLMADFDGFDTVVHYFASLLVAGMIVEQRKIVDRHNERIQQILFEFRIGPISPYTTYQLERDLQEATRELARELLEFALNSIEADGVSQPPVEITFNGTKHTRTSSPIKEQEVATLFGQITLSSFAYRSNEDRTFVYPIVAMLGLENGCTPGLVERIGFYMGEAGGTQQRTLKILLRNHGVKLSIRQLRAVVKSLSESTKVLRRAALAKQLNHLLSVAFTRKTSRLPSLVVGRDGITVAKNKSSCWECASCGTVTVYDGNGERVGTVYLAFVPEPKQVTMTNELLALLAETLRCWKGELPRLVYVTDSGNAEQSFYSSRLCRMRHPVTKKRLKWQRIVDFYHAATQLTKITKALNLDSNEAFKWGREMRRLLKMPKGLKRVLHCAAKLRQQYGTKNEELEKEYQTACNYLRNRSEWMDYDKYKADKLPIGSGVTEAACKTVYTQRVKQSGMRWSNEGLQQVLDLRVLILSNVWEDVFTATLKEKEPCIVTTKQQETQRTYGGVSQKHSKTAA